VCHRSRTKVSTVFLCFFTFLARSSPTKFFEIGQLCPKSGIDPFVANQSAIFAFLGGLGYSRADILPEVLPRAQGGRRSNLKDFRVL